MHFREKKVQRRYAAIRKLYRLAAGNQPCIKRSAQVANVHIARGARSKAGADLAVRDARFHLLKKIHDAYSSNKNKYSVNII